jgi:receptor-type tyrosine-protein phosphatase F
MLSFISRLQVKTQQGVPSQPSNLRSVESRATSITLAWEQPSHSGDNIVSYELYWNDTFSGDVSIIFPFIFFQSQSVK